MGISDIMFITIYYPPITSDSVNGIVDRINKWLRSLLSRLPIRCRPIIFTDLNSKVGLSKAPHNITVPTVSSAVGGANPGLENYTGAALREILEEFGLCFINTFGQGSQNTYYSGSHNG